MSHTKRLDLHIKTEVDKSHAEGLTTRIRAAIRNGIKYVHIYWEGPHTITSAEFLGFLLSAGKHLSRNEGQLFLYPPKGKIVSLLRIASLHNYIAQPEQEGATDQEHQPEITQAIISEGVNHE